jgi:hypothetical protein
VPDRHVQRRSGTQFGEEADALVEEVDVPVVEGQRDDRSGPPGGEQLDRLSEPNQAVPGPG